ncbi:UDP-N-acetylmuramate dehydrogenase [Salipaludibacillus sp. LMS25]|jgi:UDP-N-acetylmuramate dehydrogenase|uniref:UDP-N-acetylmuramate dehydrogenase n=1 Tax=Salipaludibacillus sp. LMS25 TaxID=2924031 RepID=UPI0020D0FC52|nr:UDP-N-acetylmuramate dehydrogenase [Salipaludibacillus sp. LMS25]UTR16172.1 UDP-N-acetylmuramate dehydrogenase [Salipaludibacillus sp. LMS25]
MFDKLGCEIHYDYNLAPLTSWKTGGACKVYIIPQTERDVIETVEICNVKKLPYFVLGNGSNILKSDKYFEGVIIHTGKALNHLSISDEKVTVGSGYMLPKLAFQLAKKSISSYAFYAGIPGTVGGAIVMNAGSAGMETKDVLLSVTYLDEKGNIHTETTDNLKMSFRSSKFVGGKYIILSANFKNIFENKEDALKKTKEIAERRRRKFPLGIPTAGSTFKSPPGGPYPGKVIEELGLKGTVFGGAKVSDVHGNWIENMGNATSEDIENLITFILQEVKDRTNIQLEVEVLKV